MIVLLTLLLAIATGLTWPAGAAAAAPDWDGDGATTADCRPLDPAVHPGATDHPDLAFEDMNCDGIDGDEANAYFVAPAGADGNVGTSNAPFQTIQRAIDAARASATKAVYVATGTYNQRIALGGDADGIRIYGGYAAGTWQRTSSTETSVNGQPEAAFLNGAIDVVVQLVALNGTRGGDKSAYGLRAVNSSEVALIQARASGGPGATGAPGGGGSTPAKAATGDAGESGPTDCNVAGAGGVFSQPGNGTDGGAGGAGGEETNDGENGQPGTKGAGTGGGSPGAGGVDIAGDAHGPNDGMHGQPGGPGDPGAGGGNGSGGANDLGAASTGWTGRNGTGGTTGGAAYGGGGGGGGAGRGGTFDWGAGAGGGQGGDGGAGGTGGLAGEWGGGSFGVYLHNSHGAVVDSSTLQSGNGGGGGGGGTGGGGGQGGDGGPGAAGRTTCGITVGSGGNGGSGGQGGGGGNGGGGSGGPSAALMRVGSSLATTRGSTLTFGAGGSGGSGGGGAGQSGASLSTAANGPTDFDSDAITDSGDNCVEIPRGTDGNGDGCPDRAAALPDGDGDGVPNSSDACPSTPAGGTDANSDGCPDSTGGGGSTGGGSTAGGSTGGGLLTGSVGALPDSTAPALVAVVRKQRPLKSRSLTFSAACSEACRLSATALHGRKKLGTLSKQLAASAQSKLRLKLSRAGLRQLRKALRKRKTVTLSLKLTAADAAGNKRSSTKKLKASR